jgi:hypothetical protein
MWDTVEQWSLMADSRRKVGDRRLIYREASGTLRLHKEVQTKEVQIFIIKHQFRTEGVRSSPSTYL